MLNWRVTNAWILEHLKSTKLPARTVRSIPFPRLSTIDCDVLTKAVREIESAVDKGSTAPIQQLEKIDKVLFAAYGLDQDMYQRLITVADWNRSEDVNVSLDLSPDTTMSNWNIIGKVSNVDGVNGLISVWLNGFRDEKWVQITPEMPGWLLRPGVSFETKIPRLCVRNEALEQVTWDFFQPQNYTYLEIEDLFNELNKVKQQW